MIADSTSSMGSSLDPTVVFIPASKVINRSGRVGKGIKAGLMAIQQTETPILVSPSCALTRLSLASSELTSYLKVTLSIRHTKSAVVPSLLTILSEGCQFPLPPWEDVDREPIEDIQPSVRDYHLPHALDDFQPHSDLDHKRFVIM